MDRTPRLLPQQLRLRLPNRLQRQLRLLKHLHQPLKLLLLRTNSPPALVISSSISTTSPLPVMASWRAFLDLVTTLS